MLATLTHELTHLVGEGIPEHGDDFAEAMGHMGIIYTPDGQHVITPKAIAIFEAVLEKLGPFPTTYTHFSNAHAFFAQHYLTPPEYDLSPYAIRRRGGDERFYEIAPNTGRGLGLYRPRRVGV
jgi:hypothetical protein